MILCRSSCCAGSVPTTRALAFGWVMVAAAAVMLAYGVLAPKPDLINTGVMFLLLGITPLFERARCNPGIRMALLALAITAAALILIY